MFNLNKDNEVPNLSPEKRAFQAGVSVAGIYYTESGRDIAITLQSVGSLLDDVGIPHKDSGVKPFLDLLNEHSEGTVTNTPEWRLDLSIAEHNLRQAIRKADANAASYYDVGSQTTDVVANGADGTVEEVRQRVDNLRDALAEIEHAVPDVSDILPPLEWYEADYLTGCATQIYSTIMASTMEEPATVGDAT